MWGPTRPFPLSTCIRLLSAFAPQNETLGIIIALAILGETQQFVTAEYLDEAVAPKVADWIHPHHEEAAAFAAGAEANLTEGWQFDLDWLEASGTRRKWNDRP